jgi:Sigma-70, region 4
MRPGRPRDECVWHWVVEEGDTLQEAGQCLGISRERVRQLIHREARRRRCHKNPHLGYAPDAWRSLDELRMHAIAAAKDQAALARYFREAVADIRRKSAAFLKCYRQWEATRAA